MLSLSVAGGRAVTEINHHRRRRHDGEGGEENDMSSSSSEGEEEYELQDIRDRIKSSRGSRFNLIENELGLASTIRSKFSRGNVINGIKDLSKDLVIHPDNKSVSLSFLFLTLFLIFN